MKTYWINFNGEAIDFRAAERPSEMLRKTFVLDKVPESAVLKFASPGWADITVNGSSPDNALMTPTVTQLDKHTSFREIDITALLKTGKNVIGAILGNGWFNCATHELWHFDKAPWRNYNRLFLELYADGEKIVATDKKWKAAHSGIYFNQFRSGEHFDARNDIPGWDLPDFDDSQWAFARQVALPPGLLIKDDTPQCRIKEINDPVKKWQSKDGSIIYDFGKNTTGFVRLTVSGKPGSKITVLYSELIDADGEIDRSNIDCYIVGGDTAQVDVYIHGNKDDFVWQPRFAYHGFRYAKLQIDGEITKLDIKACYVHNDFAPNGKAEVSHPIAAKLLDCTRNSYLGNFTGIPTDCPHREKNGWLGDALIGCEPGLWMYDGAKNYAHYLQIIADAQRITGQLSGIAPAAGWGYNHYCGPIEDVTLFEMPYLLWQFTGNISVAEKFYDNMKANIAYNLERSVDGIIEFGLTADWYSADPSKLCPIEVNNTAIFYSTITLTRKFAEIFAQQDVQWLTEIQTQVKEAFISKFRNADGSYSNGGISSLASAYGFGLDTSDELLMHIVKTIRENDYKACFGPMAARLVPRIMAENGYAAEAFKLLTQTEYPGWGYWVKQGATTLWEAWDGRDSQTHIMYGDMTAWYFRYLAGFRIAAPGFKKLLLAPQDVPEAGDFNFSYRTPFGEINSIKTGNLYRYHVPQEIELTVNIPSHWESERF